MIGVTRLKTTLKFLALFFVCSLVRNTISALEGNSNAGVIVNIVGRDHVGGMGKLFMEQYGFEEVPIKSIEASGSE